MSNLTEQFTRAANAIAEASTRGCQQSLASLNDHLMNLIERVAELERSAAKDPAEEDPKA